MACDQTVQGYRHGVVAATTGDLRRTCFEGDSGLLAVMPEECMWEGSRKTAYNRSNQELKTFNGGLIQGFTAGEPERLRGPQFHSVWDDELAAWGTANTLQNMQDAWDMQSFGLRLGKQPRVIITTTPKPFPLVMEILKRVGKDFVLTTGSSHENKDNLAKAFFDQIMKYEGTALGEQEIYARIIDLEAGGIFKRQDFEVWPYGKDLPYFDLIVQSYDTAFTEDTMNDPTACTTWGIFNNGKRHCVMLLDSWQVHMGMPELRERAYKEYNTYYGADAPVHDVYDNVVIKPGTLKNPLFGQAAKSSTGRRPDIVLIEAKGSGISLIQELDRKGVPCRAYNPGKQDKALRGHVVSHLPPAGLVYIPESGNRLGHFVSWAEDLLYQLCVKRKPQWEIAPDDLYDTFTQAMRYFVDQGWLRVGDELSELMKSEGGYKNDDRPAKRRNPYSG